MNLPATINVILPELVLAGVACLLMLMGVSHKAGVRRAVPMIAIASLVGMFCYLLVGGDNTGMAARDPADAVRLHAFGWYIKLLTCGVGALLVLVAWPSKSDATGNAAIQYGHDAGEFFGLMLLSLAGVLLVAGANDMILLFLGLELASLPVYVMVSISRPIPAAQEAGVKYFFLGAMSAAVMLFGFSYLYGATGTTDLFEIAHHFRNTFGASVTGPSHFTAWEMLAAVMLIGGFAFKLAAVPFHFYAGDVYTGAATPVTAFLSFVPKTSGLVALVKLMFVLGGGGVFAVPVEIGQLLWVMAVLTMTVGNVLGLVQQQNIKRVLAYSSIAHSGYLLAAVATMVNTGGNPGLGERALTAVLFYLTAYGITNVGTFAVLVLLPSRSDAPATSAETFDDLAGAGRRHPGLGLAMAISCFSLIGIPMTVGFFGKYLILQPTLQAAQEGSRGMYALAIITVVNAAVSSAYYLRIIAAMFLRTEPHGHVAATGAADTVHAPHPHHPLKLSFPTVLAAVLSSVGTLLFGTVLPATQVLSTRTAQAAQVDDSVNPDLASDDTDSVAPGAAKRPATLPVPPPATAARPTPPTALR